MAAVAVIYFIERLMMKNFILLVLLGFLFCSCSTLNKTNKDQSNINNKSNDKSPALTTPRVRKVWVPEKIDGDKYIEGHWMWVLERTTTWSQ